MDNTHESFIRHYFAIDRNDYRISRAQKGFREGREGLSLLAFLMTCVIGLPLTFFKYRQYKKTGKSIKYLEFKIALAVGMPIISVPILLSNMSIKWKLIAIILMLLSGVSYAYSLTSARKCFRKILGLSPEDEDTGEVIRKDNIQE